MAKPNLSGAYGIATPPPTVAFANHPDRVLHYARLLWLAWAVRIGVVGLLLFLLYVTHVI